MLCSKAIRRLIARSPVISPTKFWCHSNSRNFHNSVKIRNFSNEAKAVQRILCRSDLGNMNLAKICGVRFIHSSSPRRNSNEDNDKKNNNDDEKDRMISFLKTAVGFFVVPLFLFYIFSPSNSGGRREGNQTLRTNNIDRNNPNPIEIIPIQWKDFYQNLLMRGEVEEIIIHKGVNRATAILHPGKWYLFN